MSAKQQKHWDKRARQYLGWIRGPYVTRENTELLYAHMAHIKHNFPPHTGSRKRNILELGAGVGELAPVLFADDEGVIGDSDRQVMMLDFSSEMTKFSRERVLAAKYPVTNLRADARKVPLRDATCDEVYIVNGFHNPSVNDQLQLFSEIGRVLRPGGMLYGLFHSWESDRIQIERSAKELSSKRSIRYEVALAAEEDTNRTVSGESSVRGSMRAQNTHFDVKLYSRRELGVLVKHAGLTLEYVSDHRIDPAPYDSEKNVGFEWMVAAIK